MKIIWSTLAKDYYIYIIEQLFEKWDIKIVEKFENEINGLVKNISKNNQICSQSRITNYHKCIVNKHISLIYRIENERIEIITLLFNKSDHLY